MTLADEHIQEESFPNWCLFAVMPGWRAYIDPFGIPISLSVRNSPPISNSRTSKMGAVLSLAFDTVPTIGIMLIDLGASAAALLGLTIIVMRRRRINVLFETEYCLSRRGHRNLLKPVRATNKAFTPRGKKRNRLNIFDPGKPISEDMRNFCKRSRTWLTKRETLEEKQAVGDLSPNEATSLEEIKRDLTQISPSIWIVGQRFVELYHQQVPGSWVLEDQMVSHEEKHKKAELLCKLSFGCRARGCGCCKKPRQIHRDQRQMLGPNVQSHCTYEMWLLYSMEGISLSRGL